MSNSKSINNSESVSVALNYTRVRCSSNDGYSIKSMLSTISSRKLESGDSEYSTSKLASDGSANKLGNSISIESLVSSRLISVNCLFGSILILVAQKTSSAKLLDSVLGTIRPSARVAWIENLIGEPTGVTFALDV